MRPPLPPPLLLLLLLLIGDGRFDRTKNVVMIDHVVCE